MRDLAGARDVCVLGEDGAERRIPGRPAAGGPAWMCHASGSIARPGRA